MPTAQVMRSLVALCVGLAVLIGATTLAQSDSRAAVKQTDASTLDGDGMWIWIASKSHRGSASAIARRAKASGIETIFLKSGDGTKMWSQFSRRFVAALKRRGLKVCAWQYVYGRRPAAEARVSARAVKNGADCFIIDAESEYEGRYRSALTYVRRLRAAVSENYPIGLAAFPYVHYHPSFPYSVFMGPGGAQFNLPQMYWKAIGVSVSTVYSTTYTYNRPYGRPIFPLGQTYMNTSRGELNRFRAFAAANGATGVSWWDWQSSRARQWRALSTPLSDIRTHRVKPTKGYPLLKKGSRGDLVLWAQEHLIAAGQKAPATGYFRNQTAKAVRAFRSSRGLGTAAVINNATWVELLKLTPNTAAWKRRRVKRGVASRSIEGPASASLPAHRDERSTAKSAR